MYPFRKEICISLPPWYSVIIVYHNNNSCASASLFCLLAFSNSSPQNQATPFFFTHPGWLANIMRDWQIITDIDRISAANMYHIYGNVRRECNNSGKWKVECELDEFVNKCYEVESVTAHPFVKYQKARILSMVDRSNVLPIKHSDEIRHACSAC